MAVADKVKSIIVEQLGVDEEEVTPDASFVDDLGAVFLEPRQRLVEVVHGEHDSQVAQRVHRGGSMVGNDGRRDEARELDGAVAVRHPQHGHLDALAAHPSDAP